MATTAGTQPETAGSDKAKPATSGTTDAKTGSGPLKLKVWKSTAILPIVIPISLFLLQIIFVSLSIELR
jgi:hypothetical protein